MMLSGIRSKGKNTSLSTNTFNFSVTDKELAQKLMKSQGMEIELHYSYYNRPLRWRGDSLKVKKVNTWSISELESRMKIQTATDYNSTELSVSAHLYR